jgi:hypothetical protein
MHVGNVFGKGLFELSHTEAPHAPRVIDLRNTLEGYALRDDIKIWFHEFHLERVLFNPLLDFRIFLALFTFSRCFALSLLFFSVLTWWLISRSVFWGSFAIDWWSVLSRRIYRWLFTV